jgi:nitroreductase
MVIKEIKNRRSVRSYKKTEISEDQINELIKSAQFAPSAHHNSSWEFIVVTEQKTKKQFYDWLGQDYLLEAPVIIIPLIDTTKSERPVEDLAVASENIFLQATSLGLGTVWKNISNSEDKEKIKKLLNIPKKFMLINLIPVGYPETLARPHDDIDFDVKKIHKEGF